MTKLKMDNSFACLTLSADVDIAVEHSKYARNFENKGKKNDPPWVQATRSRGLLSVERIYCLVYVVWFASQQHILLRLVIV